jgi:hypothetical protein
VDCRWWDVLMGISGSDIGQRTRHSGRQRFQEGAVEQPRPPMPNQSGSDMKTTTLGKSGLNVSRVAFGTWQLGGDWGTFDEDTAVAAIRHARELGVNFFDTAQAYGFGASEQILGKSVFQRRSSRCWWRSPQPGQ